MPPSEHWCLLDLLGVVIWERDGARCWQADRPTTHGSSAGLAAARLLFVQVTAVCGRWLIVFIPCGMIAVPANWIIQDENHSSLLVAV